jgi:hypothetical protein
MPFVGLQTGERMCDKAHLRGKAPGGHGGALLVVLSLALLSLLIIGSGCAVMSKKLMPPEPITPTTLPMVVPVTPIPTVLSIGTEGRGIIRVNNPTLEPTMVPTVAATPSPIPAITPLPTITQAPIGLKFKQAYNLTQRLTYGQVIKAHFIPYRYQFRKYYTVWDNDVGQWLNVTPPLGNQWLFVFVTSYEDEDWRNITPVDGWGQKAFTVQWNNQIIQPAFEDRLIYQVMDEPNLFRNGYQVPYGYLWQEDPELKIRHAVQIPRLVPGKSNAWDGYIIYTLPTVAGHKDIYLLGDFLWRSAVWRFDGGDVFSL